MEAKVNSSRRFKKGDIVKLHGFDQQYIAIEDELDDDGIRLKFLGGPDDGRDIVLTCCHDGSPIEKYNVVLVRAADVADGPQVGRNRRFKKGDIVKLHGRDAKYLVVEDEDQYDQVPVQDIETKTRLSFAANHSTESPIYTGDLVLVHAVDEVEQASDASNDATDNDCDEADNYLDIDAIADICDMATQLATMSKDSLIDLAACTSDVNGISAAKGAAEIAESDGNDKPTRANYIHVILFNYIDAKYGDEND